MAKRKSKKRKPVRAAKARRAPAKKAKAAKRSARKARKAKKRPVAAKRAAAKPAAKKARKRQEVMGEGNYTAAREFDKEEKDFVRANKTRIPRMAKEAEAAMEGSEGPELARAEETARGHAYE